MTLAHPRLKVRYRLMRLFSGDRQPKSLAGKVLLFVQQSNRTTLQDVQAQFEDDASHDVIRATLSNLKSARQIQKVADEFFPVEPISLLGYPFMISVASIILPFFGMVYAIGPPPDGILFAFALVMFALGAGRLVEVAA